MIMGIGNIGIDWKYVNNTLFAGMVDFRQKSIKPYREHPHGDTMGTSRGKNGALDTENISMGLCQKRFFKSDFVAQASPSKVLHGFSACSLNVLLGLQGSVTNTLPGSYNQFYTVCRITRKKGVSPTNSCRNWLLYKLAFTQLVFAQTSLYTNYLVFKSTNYILFLQTDFYTNYITLSKPKFTPIIFCTN